VRHAVHAHFVGWRHGRVTLELRYQVRVLFQDRKGRHIAPGRIDGAILRGPAGLRARVLVGQSQWLAGNRIVPGLRGLAGGPLDRIPEPSPMDPEDIEPAGSLDEDTGEDQPSNGSPR